MKTLMINIFLIVSALGWGQTFEEIVNFDIELSSLSNPALVREIANDGRIIILEGLLRDIREENDDTETTLWITLIGGEWIGTSEVRAYTARIKFSGNEWREIFTETAQETADSGTIITGTRMLVAARLTGINPEDQVAELEMVDYRVLK